MPAHENRMGEHGKGRLCVSLFVWMACLSRLLCPHVYTEGTSSTLAPRQKHILAQRVLNDFKRASLLAVVWFGSSPIRSSPSLSTVSTTDDTQEDWERETLLMGEGGRRGNKSYDRKTAQAFFKSFTTLFSHPPPPHSWEFPSAEKMINFGIFFFCVVLYHLWIFLFAGQIMIAPRPIRNWLRKNYSENKIKYTLKKESIGKKKRKRR